MSGRLQGRDEITIAAPLAKIWSLVSDSTRLPEWGPPVRAVSIFGTAGAPEGVGTRRRVDAEFDGKPGHFVEVRTEHEEGRKISYLIEEETFGLFEVMSSPGFSLELEPVGTNATRVVFSFFHEPRGILGRLLNVLVIRRAQKKNRLAALASLRARGEV